MRSAIAQKLISRAYELGHVQVAQDQIVDVLLILCRATAPLSAVSTRCPAPESTSAMNIAMAGSSSTTKSGHEEPAEA